MSNKKEHNKREHNKREHNKREHKECGGSSSHRWTRCSGSIFLGREVGELPEKKVSAYGTDTHELAEVCINDYLDHKLLGTDPEQNYKQEKSFRDELQICAVEVYRDYIWDEVLENSITNKAWYAEGLLTHTKTDKMGGTADFWAVHTDDKGQRVLHIVDFKNGTDPVAITHEQFVYYGICFRSVLRAAGKDIDRLVTHLVQPNSLNGVKTSSKAYTPKQMDAKEDFFLKAIHKIYVEKKCTFKVGHWCKWCNGKSKCEKNGKQVEMDTGLSLLSEDVQLPEVKSLTSEQAVAIALNSDKLTQLCKACKAFIIAEHMRGEPVSGCKVIQTSPRRSIPKDSSKLEERLAAEGFKHTDTHNSKIKGIGALESLLGDKKKLLEKYITFNKPTASVVTADDPRPAATDLTSLLTD